MPVDCGRHHSQTSVAKAFTSAGQLSLARDFVTTVERKLFFNVGLWIATLLLALLLPRVRSPDQATTASGVH